MANINGALISVELAHFLKRKFPDLPSDAFRCPTCHQPLHPFGGQHPHFEHAQGFGDGCVLGSQAWQRKKARDKAMVAEAKKRGIV